MAQPDCALPGSSVLAVPRQNAYLTAGGYRLSR